MRRLLPWFLLVLAVTSCRKEILRDVKATRVKYPLTKIGDEDGENFGQARLLSYVRPRAYPADEIDARLRMKAYLQLARMRQQLERRHRSAGYCEPPQGNEKAKCGPAGPGGPGPSPGGPGGPGGRDPNGCAWSSVGPTNINGRITSIAIDPNNNQRIFAASVGGLWRSVTGGRRWQRVSDDFISGVFASIAVNGSEVVAGGGDPNYGSGGNGVWQSTHNGDPGSWSKVSPPVLDNQTIWRIRVDPASGDLYFATSAGVWVARHTGTTLSWSLLDGFNARTNDIAIDFGVRPPLVYAAVIGSSPSFGVGIWKHGAAGTTWQERDSGIATGSIGRIALGLAASSPSTLYAKISNNADGKLLGVFKTTTAGEATGGGNAWASLGAASALNDSLFPAPSTQGYSNYNSVLEVDPTDPNTVYAGGMSLFRTTDGGGSWNNVSGGGDTGFPFTIHSDQHAIAFDPSNHFIVVVGGDGGISKSTDVSAGTWHWNDASHGMVITEFYRITSQQGLATVLAGGAQDNGTDITFGNRTWYQPGGCDGATVAIDAADPDTLYGNCNGALTEFTNPIPGWAGGPSNVGWTTPNTPIHPLVTDPSVAGAAVSHGAGPTDATGALTAPNVLLKTTDGLTWTVANSAAPLALGQGVVSIAIAPSSSFQTWYVGVDGKGGATPSIWVTTNGGTTWNTSATGLPNLSPNALAIDYTNPLRAFAGFGGGGGGAGGVYMTTNGGTSWTPMSGAGSTALPSTPVTAVVIDPNDAQTLYLGTNIGAFRGKLTGTPPVAAWVPFDEGLPDGMDVADMWVNRNTGVLSIAAYGHGTFQRDIRPGVACQDKMLLVRDNVYDRGLGPSVSGVPDPEHPIPDPARSGFFMPDNTDPGQVFWWSSTDIRIDVPSVDTEANALPNADHVEMQTCPIEMSSCPAGTLLDSNPVRSVPAKAYVQVTNTGLDPIQNVRVIALYADASSGLPLLPPDFWTTTFPPGGGACGPLAAGSGWKFVDTSQPCQTISVVNPAVPETSLFNWNVPVDQAEHTCLFTVAESADDPLDPSIRATNELQPWVLVPNNRQIANRNLHVVDVSSGAGGGASGMAGGTIPRFNKDNTGTTTDVEISAAGLPPGSELVVLLSRGTKVESAEGAVQGQGSLGNQFNARAQQLGVDAGTFWKVSGREALFRLPPNAEAKFGLGFHLGSSAKSGTTWRIPMLTRVGGQVMGGSIYYLRVK